LKKGSTVEGIEIVDIGAKGKVIGKKDGQTFMTSGAIPGDVVSIQIKKSNPSLKSVLTLRANTLNIVVDAVGKT
jgi:predicted RNA-binding protein with TRAM domain